ncbi:MAG: AAA family ATPase [Leptospiraceae bacterium]|nr:AAA family ATPase [Leptospiraceae bacterium]
MKKLPIGNSNFREVIEDNYFYVDKSLLIQEVLDSGSKISLITRPRRFGKTINLSMLKCWFEVYQDSKSAIPNSELFQNLKIWKLGDEYTKHCGKYPVIYLTFKDVKESKWENCQKFLKRIISSEYERHSYLLDSNSLTDAQKKLFRSIQDLSADFVTYETSLKKLSEFLHLHYGEKVVVLIDEYDTPVHEAYYKKYYDLMVDFYRTFLGAGLKDNEHLEKSVITGILRISKESVFSDLNNFSVYTVLNNRFADKFGFTQEEVTAALDYYQLTDKQEGVKTWYNGYVFGNQTDIYNPWSILNFLEHHSEGLKPHWVNTSSNLIIRDLLSRADSESKKDMESLLKRETIEKEVQVDTVFSEIENGGNTLWSFLLFSGYLKVVRQRVDGKRLYSQLLIPNLEIEYLYERFISGWLTDNLQSYELKELLNSLLTGNVDNLQFLLQKFILNSFSYLDPTGKEPERVYHAFILGLLLHLSDSHSVKSNRESGFGRYDIMLIPKRQNGVGVVIEFKLVYPHLKETLAIAAEKALGQIEDNRYEEELKSMGASAVLKYGMAFEGKEVLVLKG